MVYLYATDEQINQFAISYIINPSLHINKVFREQVEKLLRATFHENTMETISLSLSLSVLLASVIPKITRNFAVGFQYQIIGKGSISLCP